MEKKQLEELPQPQKKKRRSQKVLAIIFLCLATGGVGTFFYGKYFIEQQLSPLVQTELNRLLKRPVSLGGVDRFSWNGVRFGKTEIPVTDSEQNFVVVEAIDVQVDLWNYVQTRQLGLDVTVVRPQVFLRQSFTTGQYVPKFEVPTTGDAGNIDLRTVKVEDADLILQPLNSRKAIALTQLNLQSEWQLNPLNNPSRVQFTGGGKIVSPKLLNSTIPKPEELRQAIASETKSNNGTLNITKGEFNLSNGSGNLSLRSQDVSVAVIDGFFLDFPVTPLQGKADGTVAISLKSDSDRADIQGNLRVRDVAIGIKDVPKPIQNISGDVLFDGTTVTLQGISGSYGSILARVNGNANMQAGLNVDVVVEPTDIAAVLSSLEVKPPFPVKGEIKLSVKVMGKQPQITANFASTKPVKIDRLIISQVQGQIESKDGKSLSLKQLRAESAVGSLSGLGIMSLGQNLTEISELNFNFDLANINSEAIALLYETKLPIPVGAVAAQVQVVGDGKNPQVLANFQAPSALYPTTGEVEISGTTATLKNTKVQFGTGSLGLTGAIALDGKRPWQLQLNSNGTPLSIFPTLPDVIRSGNLFGILKLSSSEGSFQPQDIRGNGDFDLRLIKTAISANIIWDGKNLVIPQVLVDNALKGNGVVALDQKLAVQDVNFNLRSPSPQPFKNYQDFLSLAGLSGSNLNLPENGTVDINAKVMGSLNNLRLLAKVKLEGLEISELVAFGANISPNSKAIPQGKLAFAGEVRGVFNASTNSTQFQPQAQGVVRLTNLRLDQTNFDPLIAGDLSFRQGRLTIDLAGKSDRLAVRLDRSFQPIDFNIQLASTSIVGNRLKTDNQKLAVKLESVPLALVSAIAGQGDLIGGTLSSDVVVDLRNKIQAIADVTISKPRFGQTQGEKITAKLNYNNGNLVLSNGLLDITSSQNSKYKFDLVYSPTAANTLQGKLGIESGTVAELFNFFRLEQASDLGNIFNPPQYGKAEQLRSLPQVKIASFYEQLQYFSQVKARKDQQDVIAAESNANLPPLREFKGELQGDIGFTASQANGVKFGFNLVGKGWDYGKFAIEDVQLKGNFNRDTLTLETVRLQSGDRLGQITNTKIAVKELNGKIELANFPVESLRPIPFFNNLPVDVTGLANGFVNLGGGLFNPKATGRINLAEATINRQPLDTVGGDFNYGNGRLQFKGRVVTNQAQTEPISIDGDIPYQFCPIPEGNSLQTLCGFVGNVSNALKIDIKVKNEGLAFINILNTPVRWLSGKGTGAIAIGGTFEVPKIKGNLTLDQAAFQVAGLPSDITEVLGKVEFDFDRFNADLLGKFSQGNFTANGVLAIANSNLITQGDRDFDNPLTIIATKLNLDLKNLYAGFADGALAVGGSLLFPEVSGKIVLSDGRVILSEQSIPEKEQFNLGFSNLMVTLGDAVQVTQSPLLNLLARGELIINGSLDDIRPSGRVRIERGQINTISTRLRLDRDFANYADFVASQGLNPNLNVRVLGTIPEVTRTRIDDSLSLINTFTPTNAPISSFGEQRTIQIQGTVTGSVQSPNIELRSSPPRSQSELLTLLGGGLLQQGGSDPTAVLANLAGGTIIGLLQDAIGDVLSIAEFNLSPTTTSARGGGLSTIGLAAEAALSLTPSFSFAIRTVLNDPSQVTNYTFRYRVNPNTLVLSNTDLRGNNSLSVEYETRF